MSTPIAPLRLALFCARQLSSRNAPAAPALARRVREGGKRAYKNARPYFLFFPAFFPAPGKIAGTRNRPHTRPISLPGGGVLHSLACCRDCGAKGMTNHHVTSWRVRFGHYDSYRLYIVPKRLCQARTKPRDRPVQSGIATQDQALSALVPIVRRWFAVSFPHRVLSAVEFCRVGQMICKRATFVTLAALAAWAPANAAVTISSHETQNMNCSGGVCSPTATKAVLNVGDLTTMLASGSVTVTTRGSGGIQSEDIDLAAPLSWSSNATLKLDAYRSLEIDKSVSVLGSGGLALVTNDGGSEGALILRSEEHTSELQSQ